MSPRLAEAGLLSCAAVWGATFYKIKDALAGVHPVALVAHRFLLSAALLLPWVALRRKPWILLKEGAVLAALLAALYVSQTAGLAYTSASSSGFITGLFIFFVPLFLLIFFRRPPTRAQWFSVAVALAGLWLLTGGAREFNRGDALTILSAVAYAAHLLATDRFVKEDADPILIAFHQFWMTGLACLLFSSAMGYPGGLHPERGLGDRLSGGRADLVRVLSNAGPKKTDPESVLIFSLEPVFGAIFAWTLGRNLRHGEGGRGL